MSLTLPMLRTLQVPTFLLEARESFLMLSALNLTLLVAVSFL